MSNFENHSDFEYFLEKVTSSFNEFTSRFRDGNLDSDVARIDLNDLINSFPEIKEDTFLTPAVLINLKQQLWENIGKIRIVFPHGSRVTLIALPCDGAGKEYDNETFDDLKTLKKIEENESLVIRPFSYFHILVSDPKDSGQTTKLSGAFPAPFLKLLPEEIINHCSFQVEYVPADDLASQNVLDYQILEKLFEAHYEKLRQLYLGGQK